jgi:tRNA(fMet)-specific endonuclease VapC
MKRYYLLDTGIAQDFQDDRRGVRAKAKEVRALGHRVGICVPVLGELWSGVEGSHRRDANAQQLRMALGKLLIWPYTTEAAEEFGRIFAALRKSGRIIPQIDVQIAAIARTLPNCVLVTKDADFSAVSELLVENWAS